MNEWLYEFMYYKNNYKLHVEKDNRNWLAKNS